MDIRVECYAGYRAEQEPRRFFLGERPVEVIDILDRWLAPEHRYFKVKGDDGGTYILRHDVGSGRWELTLFVSNGLGEPAATVAARRAWNSGYFVITFDQRGFGDSGGLVNGMDPDIEGRDVQAILDWAEAHLQPHLAYRGGDPLVGSLGLSYGGGYQTIGSAVDPRFDVIVPTATWNDLRYSLYPNGVPKLEWVNLLVSLGGLGARGAYALFIWDLYTEAQTGTLSQSSVDLLYAHSLRSFCDRNRPDGRGAPRVDALFIQASRDLLFNMNEGVANAACLAEAGNDARLLVLRTGHLIPAQQDAAAQPLALYGMDLQAKCGSQVFDTAQMMVDFLNQKLKGVRPAVDIPKICIVQDDDHGLVLNQVPVGGDAFSVAPATLTNGPILELTLQFLRGLSLGELLELLANVPGNTQELAAAILDVNTSTESLVAVLPYLVNLVPPEVVNEVASRGHFVPLHVAHNGGDLAGIPMAALEVSGEPNPQQPVVFVGLGRRRAGSETVELISDQVTPIKGFGQFNGQLAGISTHLDAGDTVGLLIYGFHPLFMQQFALLPTPVTVSGEVRLPLH